MKTITKLIAAIAFVATGTACDGSNPFTDKSDVDSLSGKLSMADCDVNSGKLHTIYRQKMDDGIRKLFFAVLEEKGIEFDPSTYSTSNGDVKRSETDRDGLTWSLMGSVYAMSGELLYFSHEYKKSNGSSWKDASNRFKSQISSASSGHNPDGTPTDTVCKALEADGYSGIGRDGYINGYMGVRNFNTDFLIGTFDIPTLTLF